MRRFILLSFIFLLAFPYTCWASEVDEGGEGISLAALGDWLIHIVVPRDNFFEGQFFNLEEKAKAKLPYSVYIATIGRMKEISGALDGDASALDIQYEYDGESHTIELGKFIAPHLPKIRMVVTGLYVIFLAYYNYRQMMFLIRGSTYQTMSAYGNHALDDLGGK